MHYVDEGSGEPILFVHGTPTWSFLYRFPISRLRDDYRCVAPDHLGHGLSEKRRDADYRPEAHAERLAAFVRARDLSNITLVVHDFGGPIGIHCMRQDPQRYRQLIVSNTWLGPLKDARLKLLTPILNSVLGKWLYLKRNISVEVLLPSLFADKSLPTKAVFDQYRLPHLNPEDRYPLLALAKSLTGSRAMYEANECDRDLLRSIPVSLVWGLKDPSFLSALDEWRKSPIREELVLPSASHFVWEESPDECLKFLRRALNN